MWVGKRVDGTVTRTTMLTIYIYSWLTNFLFAKKSFFYSTLFYKRLLSLLFPISYPVHTVPGTEQILLLSSITAFFFFFLILTLHYIGITLCYNCITLDTSSTNDLTKLHKTTSKYDKWVEIYLPGHKLNKQKGIINSNRKNLEG